jgi:hypothetical protein
VSHLVVDGLIVLAAVFGWRAIRRPYDAREMYS